MNWKIVQSTEKPQEIDTTSSKTVNYVRKNVHTIEIDGAEIYEYEELEVSKDVWLLYQELEQAKADIDYLNMITEDL